MALLELSSSHNLFFHVIDDFEGWVDWAECLDGAAGTVGSTANLGTADVDLLECMDGLTDAGEASLECLTGFESDSGIDPMNIIGAVRGDGGGGGANMTGTSIEPCELFEPSLLFVRR